MAYDPKAQKKYREKVKNFVVRYTPTDMPEAIRFQSYLSAHDISTNAYLKSLIKRDMDEKGIPYPQESNPE